MNRTQVAVVGGGLCGIRAAQLLQQHGIACVVLEARQRPGGRILSVQGSTPVQPPAGLPAARHDLGPAWFWPDFQPRITQLVDQLGLQAFAQHTDGDLLLERSAAVPPERYRGSANSEPRAMRVAGGMLAMLEALAKPLRAGTLRLNSPVVTLTRTANGRIELLIAGDQPQSLQADQVILALPPRLAEETVAFVPALEAATRQAWRATPTWMAGHAKALAVYDRAFWRQAGLSGMASSQVGPLVEIHDASAPGGPPALFGFLGISASSRMAMGAAALRSAVLAQLVRLFGAAAAQPVDFWLQDWAAEPQTATLSDRAPPAGHPAYGFAPRHQSLWNGTLLLAGTEAARTQGGYLEGALAAAEQAVAQITAQVKAPGT